MIIERNIERYVVHSGDPLGHALAKISENRSRVVFVVASGGVLQGVLSDGDVRRWIEGRGTVDLDVPALDVANRTFTSAPIGRRPADIAGLFGSGIDHIPLVDAVGRFVAVAIDRPDELRIGPLTVAVDRPTVVVAEIGNNHNGSIELAKRLVDEAVDAGADCVKFQLRDLASLYRGSAEDPSLGEDLGPQYTLDLLERFSLDAEALFEVFDHCGSRSVPVICTPWDLPSLAALVDYGVPALKIASADLTNHELLRAAAASGRPVILSTGMSTEDEIIQSVAQLERSAASFALLHCNSTYPAPFKDVNLRYLARLAEIGGCPVGYSGHERGHHVPLAAVALGARIIEKHFTLDRSMEGNDHRVSLLPSEFAEMVNLIREVESSLGGTGARGLTQGEMMNRVNLAKSLVAARPIRRGETITADSVMVRSPGRGLQPNSLGSLVGRTAVRDVEAGDFFYPTDIGTGESRPRDYSFRRPWGLPVRFHDHRALAGLSNPDFLEFHLSYKDMERPLTEVFDDVSELGFIVHSPELFEHDHIMDLASTDAEYRKRSIVELQRVVELTRELTRWFPREQNPAIIVNVGGFTRSGFIEPDDRRSRYDLVEDAFARIDADGVELLAQTMPPFPWLMGGQMYHNLFLTGADIAWFADTFGRRVCLDTSHSRLSATRSGESFAELVERVAPHARHLHLVDATGVDGEGVQVGEGDIDWAELCGLLDEFAPGVGFIPEIWQGHVDDGAGFWKALERLEPLL